MTTTRVPTQQKMFRVYLFGQSRKAESRLCVDAATADYWVMCGWASNLGKGNIALKKSLYLKLYDRSCNIKESTIHAAIDGSIYCRAIIESWSCAEAGS